MFKNYMKIALRNLHRNKSHAFINISGLTIGLVCCLLIFEYVVNEHRFDDFNANKNDLYRITQTTIRSGGEPDTGTLGGWRLGEVLGESVPEVVRFARIHPDYASPVIYDPEKPEAAFEEEHVFYTDAAFLEMFSYPLVAGNPEKALSEPGTLLLSESMAEKYFGNENPIGKTLNVTGWISGDFRVNGVLKDVPQNSHLEFDFLLPVVDLLANSRYSDPETGWNWSNFITYVQLQSYVKSVDIHEKLTTVLWEHRRENYEQINATATWQAQPLAEIHLNDDIFAPRVRQGSYKTVYFFSMIGLITLLIALINYINLTTARAIDRAREVGVRKVVGANRKQLIRQFLFETGLTMMASVWLAVALASVLRPVVNGLAGIEIPDALWSQGWPWAILLGVTLFGTLLGGLYPAFVLSAFKPVSVLKSRSGATATRQWLRQSLVVTQFAASIALLSGVAIVYSQVDYMRNFDNGMDMEQILTLAGPRVLPEGTTRSQAMEVLSGEFKNIPGIQKIATSNALPGQGFNWYTSGMRKQDADPSEGISGVVSWIDTSFASLYGLEIIEGTGFKNVSMTTPDGEPTPAIINETAARKIGFDSPADALGEILNTGPAEVVGVFKDFNWSSAHQEREAAVFLLNSFSNNFSMKVSTENLPETISTIRSIFTAMYPGNPFQYDFLDEKFAEQFRSDQQFVMLFSIFTGLAILISCLGLFGLASFSARQRTKEIGIRKVLGASVLSVAGLLSKSFIKLVVLANIIAWPLAWYLMSQWLDNFAYRIEISWWFFALAGGLALLIAVATVSWQAFQAATANPVKALRYE